MSKRERNEHQLSSTTKIVLGVALLITGCLIYLLFRSNTIYIYTWCCSLGLSGVIDTLRFAVCDWIIPNFIKFNLPDGLYCVAYLLIIDAIWHDDKSWLKLLILATVPTIIVFSEIMQYFGLIRGTFDVCDLLCYILPTVLYIIMINIKTLNLIKARS